MIASDALQGTEVTPPYSEKKVVVCIPAYNEARSISSIVEKTKRYASEVIVYDDGSKDNTGDLAKASGATVIYSPVNRGYGTAISALFQAAKASNADVMVTLDSDGQHDPDQIPVIKEPILKGNADIVIGSRFINPDHEQKIPRYRTFGIKAITRVTRAGSYHAITDSQSGFRAYNRTAIIGIDLFEEGMQVSTEILFRAKEKNLRIHEVPIMVTYDTKKTSTHNPLLHGINVLFHAIQLISLRHPLLFYGCPGLVLLLISAFIANSALELFSQSRYVSTNLILVTIGLALVGMIFLATGAIVYTLIALFKGKLKDA